MGLFPLSLLALIVLIAEFHYSTKFIRIDRIELVVTNTHHYCSFSHNNSQPVLFGNCWCPQKGNPFEPRGGGVAILFSANFSRRDY